MSPNYDETDLYSILGVLPDASGTEIKSAYRKKALLHHPDKLPPGASHEDFTKVQNAYETLRDEASRAAYDLRRKHSTHSTSSKKSNCQSSYSSKQYESTRTRHTSSSSSNVPPPKATESSHAKYTSSSSHNFSNTSNSGGKRNQYNYQDWYSTGSMPKEDHGQNRHDQYQDRTSRTSSQRTKTDENSSNPFHSTQQKSHGTHNASGQHQTHNYHDRYSTSSKSYGDHSRNTHEKYQYQTSGTSTGTSSSTSTKKTKTDKKPSNPFRSSGKTAYGEKQKKATKERPRKPKEPSYAYCEFTSRNKQKSSGRTYTYQQVPSYPQGTTRKTFGMKATGEPCMNCMGQGRYCWQHQWQDKSKTSANSMDYGFASSIGSAGGTRSLRKTWGVTSHGEPCKNCIKQGGYCWQHVCQDRSSSNVTNRSPPSSYVQTGRQSTDENKSRQQRTASQMQPKAQHGVTKKGLPCKRCTSQGKFCYQHS